MTEQTWGGRTPRLCDSPHSDMPPISPHPTALPASCRARCRLHPTPSFCLLFDNHGRTGRWLSARTRDGCLPTHLLWTSCAVPSLTGSCLGAGEPVPAVSPSWQDLRPCHFNSFVLRVYVDYTSGWVRAGVGMCDRTDNACATLAAARAHVQFCQQRRILVCTGLTCHASCPSHRLACSLCSMIKHSSAHTCYHTTTTHPHTTDLQHTPPICTLPDAPTYRHAHTPTPLPPTTLRTHCLAGFTTATPLPTDLSRTRTLLAHHTPPHSCQVTANVRVRTFRAVC